MRIKWSNRHKIPTQNSSGINVKTYSSSYRAQILGLSCDEKRSCSPNITKKGSGRTWPIYFLTHRYPAKIGQKISNQALCSRSDFSISLINHLPLTRRSSALDKTTSCTFPKAFIFLKMWTLFEAFSFVWTWSLGRNRYRRWSSKRTPIFPPGNGQATPLFKA